MLEILKLVGTVLGGLGLFLLAINMMTDGLKLAAGKGLRNLLSNWTKTPFRGIVSGFLMTAIVQSSSAVTVATLGFVNAGIISMKKALGIIFGTNVGTTVTGWLVAIIGFKLKIQVFALPMIGLGMLLTLVRPNSKLSSTGIALVGFGLFFVGLDVLKTAFEGMEQLLDVSTYTAEGVSGLFSFFLIGLLMTVVTQSSSASIALVIAAASSGIIGLYAAASMVIGANVGTTSTAMLVAIGATSNAKRVALAQIIFNLGTALVALIIMFASFYILDQSPLVDYLNSEPAITLAIFHTGFNVLGVLLTFPLINQFAVFLETRFVTWEEKKSNPRYLDDSVAQTPDMAVNAVTLELVSVSEKVIQVYRKAFLDNQGITKFVEEEINVAKSLLEQVSKFIVNVDSYALSKATSSALTDLMRVEQYLLSCLLAIERLELMAQDREPVELSESEDVVADFRQLTFDYIELLRTRQFENVEGLKIKLDMLVAKHDDFKQDLIIAGTKKQISVRQMSQAIDCLAEMRWIAQQWFKAYLRIHNIEKELRLSRSELATN